MIRVVRGPEPDVVRKSREKNLPIAYVAWVRHGPGTKQLLAALTDYDAGKDWLFIRQHEKCAYCERSPGLSNQPLEHFRPKPEAWRHCPDEKPTVIDRGHYWWLTWTWENQFFACATCNGRGTKGNFFPLKSGTPLSQPPRGFGGGIPHTSAHFGLESALLLDPSDLRIDPFDHLQWEPANRLVAPSLWTWTLATPTDEGFWTSRILRLGELAGSVTARYRDAVWPRFVSEVTSRRRNLDAAHEAWLKLGTELTHVTASFAAATWWQFETLRMHRTFRDLELPPLPRPGA